MATINREINRLIQSALSSGRLFVISDVGVAFPQLASRNSNSNIINGIDIILVISRLDKWLAYCQP